MDTFDKCAVAVVSIFALSIPTCTGIVMSKETSAKEEMVKAGHSPLAAKCAFAASTDAVCAVYAAAQGK